MTSLAKNWCLHWDNIHQLTHDNIYGRDSKVLLWKGPPTLPVPQSGQAIRIVFFGLNPFLRLYWYFFLLKDAWFPTDIWICQFSLFWQATLSWDHQFIHFTALICSYCKCLEMTVTCINLKENLSSKALPKQQIICILQQFLSVTSNFVFTVAFANYCQKFAYDKYSLVWMVKCKLVGMRFCVKLSQQWIVWIFSYLHK